MRVGAESKNKVIAAAALGVVAVLALVLVYELMPSSPTSAAAPATPGTQPAQTGPTRPSRRGGASAKKGRLPQSLDPTLNLTQLAAAEQVKYEGSGRNIFISQAEITIPQPNGPGHTDTAAAPTYVPPQPAAPPPIPLKFFGFASQPGEPKKVFLSKGDDVFIAGEGEIVDRRYKVLHILPTSVEVQDVVSSGPPQSLPLLTQS